MSSGAHIIRQVLVTAVVAGAISFAVPVFIDRRDYTSAVVNAAKDPSPKNEAILNAERAKNQQLSLEMHLIGALGLFGLMNLGYPIVKRWGRRR